MSSESWLEIFAIPAEEVPSKFESEAEVSNFFRPFYDAELPGKESRYLSGCSRNCWFEWIVSRLLNETEIEGLRFLSGQKWTRKFEVDFEGSIVEDCVVNVFSETEIEKIVSLMQSFLEVIQNKFEFIAATMDAGFKPSDIQAAYEKIPASSSPNKVHYGEDGDGVEYLFSVLKQVLIIFRFALTNKMKVVSSLGQPHGGGAVTKAQVAEGLRRQYDELIERYGDEIGPGVCRKEGCSRLHTQNNYFCQKHRFETNTSKPWPYDAFENT